VTVIANLAAHASLFSFKKLHFKQVSVQLVRTLTTWHCPHSPAEAAAIDRHLPILLPGRVLL